jgi:hypothetical protein
MILPLQSYLVEAFVELSRQPQHGCGLVLETLYR